ncbi:hypothetical protein [Modicisalibacter luteus]|uniref:Uncharacterized protein n=1 Tax=Modicisalibacter luteus TaxID=453962 RepID=A0ABV7M647_9GAMM|nr:hypothetical protein [Halomonas lutea]GHA99423.1 hypothetical protein GCM10007159_21510 [Halomonas lutea]
MNDLLSLINEYRIILGAIALLLITTLLLRAYWEQVGFFWLRVRCAMPIFGKVAKLSKQTNAREKDSGWFSSERLLCAEFLHYYQNVNKDEEFFGKCQSYLSKAQETGRKKLHLLGWVLIALMVFVEAMGFSYVLAGWTIPGASEALQQQGAVGIAFLISALLVYLTHKTGHEMHQNHLVRKVRTWFSGERDQLIPDTSVTLEDNERDDGQPAWKQLLNRVSTNAHVKPSHTITIVTLVFIVAVAIGATYVRGQALDEMLSRQQITPENTMSGGYQDPYSSTALPDELAGIQRAADESAQDSALSHQRKGGWGTFIVLAVIFVFLQIMGIMIGYFTGFAGKESAAARGYIGGFKNKQEFANYYAKKRMQYAQVAQKYLSRLQHAMVGHAQHHNTDGDSINQLRNPGQRTFLAYVDDSLQRQHESEAKQRTRQTVTPEPLARAEPAVSNADSVPPMPVPDVARAADDTSLVESDDDMEGRIRKKLEAEMKAKQAQSQQQREADMEAQLRKEMGLE